MDFGKLSKRVALEIKPNKVHRSIRSPQAMRTSGSFRWRVGSEQRLNPARVSISPSLLASSPAFGYSMKPSSVQVCRLHPMGFGHGLLLHHKPPWAAMPNWKPIPNPSIPRRSSHTCRQPDWPFTFLAQFYPVPYRTRTWPNPPHTWPVPEIFIFGEKGVRLGYACSGTPAVSVPTRYPVRVRRGFCRTGASLLEWVRY